MTDMAIDKKYRHERGSHSILAQYRIAGWAMSAYCGMLKEMAPAECVETVKQTLD